MYEEEFKDGVEYDFEDEGTLGYLDLKCGEENPVGTEWSDCEISGEEDAKEASSVIESTLVEDKAIPPRSVCRVKAKNIQAQKDDQGRCRFNAEFEVSLGSKEAIAEGSALAVGDLFENSGCELNHAISVLDGKFVKKLMNSCVQ